MPVRKLIGVDLVKTRLSESDFDFFGSLRAIWHESRMASPARTSERELWMFNERLNRRRDITYFSLSFQPGFS